MMMSPPVPLVVLTCRDEMGQLFKEICSQFVCMPNSLTDKYGLDMGLLRLVKSRGIAKRPLEPSSNSQPARPSAGKADYARKADYNRKADYARKADHARKADYARKAERPREPQPCACRLGPCTKASFPFTRVLDQKNAPEIEYARTPSNVRHAGQLKLLCSEIEFLTRYKGTPLTVVYAGSAPGLHIPRLARMFPEKAFVLVDPHRSVVRGHQNIQVIRGLMTVPLALDLSKRLGRDILFISDVRVGAEVPGESDRDQQERIHRDMISQFEWHDTLDPIASMFKFRLPWDLEIQTLYLEGEIQLPVFGKHLTHEARLIVQRDAGLVPYDNPKYERQMAFFNRVQRVALYDGGLCYDCTAFRSIVGGYLAGGATTAEEVEEMCRDIESELATGWRAQP